MAKNDQEEAFEKLLSATLLRTIDFVKFGETKNAALLTFSSVWILASVNLRFGSSPVSSPDWRIATSIALPLFCASALISILSFLPRLDLKKLSQEKSDEKSLLYFGDISTFTAAAYRERIRQRYMPPEGITYTQNYLDDLATQIKVNSNVAMRKYRLFKTAAYVALAAITSLTIPGVRNAAALLANFF